MDRVIVADVRLPARHRATVEAIGSALARGGAHLERFAVPAAGLPVDGDIGWRGTSFTGTPEVLIESWRVARHLEAGTDPGDVVLVAELAAAGGVFALEEAMKPQAERRRVLVAAGDGEMLQHMAVAGTFDGVAAEAEYAIDWELVAYRHAAAVLTTSDLATSILEQHGVAATTVDISEKAVPASGISPPRRIVLPEEVGRLAASAQILRALSGVLGELDPGVEIFVSPGARPDLIWKGTTWDSLDQLRAIFGSRLRRGLPSSADLVILGDPWAQPGGGTTRLRASGARIIVPQGSAASNRWPDAEVWADEDQLAAAVLAPSSTPPIPTRTGVALSSTMGDPSRAQRVSVAVPVFRDLTHLDECLSSIVVQTQLPHEILLVDDGSASLEVGERLERWRSSYPDLIRVLLQDNRGVCVARNAAIEAMTGDAFTLVDSDDVLHPDFIVETAQALRADTSLWAVATWTEFFGEYEGVEGRPPFDRRVGRRENPIIATAALVDMSVRDSGIRFTPDLAFVNCEDWAVWSEIVAAGGRFGLITKPLSKHRVHTDSGGHRRTGLAYSLGKARATAPLR